MGVFLMGFGRKRQRRLEANRLTSKGKRDVKVPCLGFVAGRRGQAAKQAFPSPPLIAGWALGAALFVCPLPSAPRLQLRICKPCGPAAISTSPRGFGMGEAGENPALDLTAELESELVGLGRTEPVLPGMRFVLDMENVGPDGSS